MIELMVSVAILSILMVAFTYIFTRQSRTYTVVDQVAESQQNLRGIAGLLEREMRTTGFMVPESAAFCGGDRTGDADVLVVTDAEAIDPTSQTRPRLGAKISAGYAGTSNETLSVNDVTVDGDAFYDLDGDGTPDADFLYDAGGGGRTGAVIVVDLNDPSRGSSCGFLTDVDTSASTITADFTLGGAVSDTQLASPSGTEDLIAVPAHYYRVDANNRLIRDGMVLAHDVEDMQFALFYDVDGNGSVGSPSNELPGSDSSVPQYQSDSWNNQTLREVRLAFVVRTQSEDRDVLEDSSKAQNTFQTNFNRSDPGGSDGFRRRVYTTNIRPRNVGLR